MAAKVIQFADYRRTADVVALPVVTKPQAGAVVIEPQAVVRVGGQEFTVRAGTAIVAFPGDGPWEMTPFGDWLFAVSPTHGVYRLDGETWKKVHPKSG